MQQVLALRQNRIFLNICDYFKKYVKKHRDSTSHIERTVNVLGEGPTKITITNASIDKQITLKRDYIYKIENTELEIGVSGVLLRILFYFEACRCSRQTGSVNALRINLLFIMIPDGLNARVLKEYSIQISPILALIYNESLAQGNFPDDWRHANVSPVFKKGEKYDAANYRPVSLTCICCKTLEHILVSNINKHLALDSILADCQHGFRSRRSCETQLVQFVHDIISNLDGVMNRGHKQTDLISQRHSTRSHTGGYYTTRLLWDTRVHLRVDQLMALWAQSTSSFRRSSLRSSHSFIRCTPGVSLRTDPFPNFH